MATVACLGPLAGCGSTGEGPTTTAARSARPAALPPGWTRLVNRRAGFTIGLPPGWRSARQPRVTVLRAPNRAVGGVITADASPGLPDLETYTRRTVRQVAKDFRDLKSGRATPLPRAPHPTMIMLARGTFEATGVPQSIVLATVRPAGGRTYSLLLFRNARSGSPNYRPTTSRMIRSFVPLVVRAASAGG